MMRRVKISHTFAKFGNHTVGLKVTDPRLVKGLRP